MLKVAIIIGSTRPGRKAEVVARWVYDIASKRSDAAFEIVDIKDFNLPLLDEPVPAAMGLGRVKTLIVGLGRLASSRRHAGGPFWAFVAFRGMRDALPAVLGPFKSEGQRLAHAPIAAISGLTPTMFITRVRL